MKALTWTRKNCVTMPPLPLLLRPDLISFILPLAVQDILFTDQLAAQAVRVSVIENLCLASLQACCMRLCRSSSLSWPC